MPTQLRHQAKTIGTCLVKTDLPKTLWLDWQQVSTPVVGVSSGKLCPIHNIANCDIMDAELDL